MAPADFQDQPSPQNLPRPQTPQEDFNYVKEAFHSQYNWIAMTGARVFALLSGTFLPIILAAGLEMIYLAIVPQSSRFRRLIRSLKFAEEQRKHQERLNEMLKNLPAEMQSSLCPRGPGMRFDPRQFCAVVQRIPDLSGAD